MVRRVLVFSCEAAVGLLTTPRRYWPDTSRTACRRHAWSLRWSGWQRGGTRWSEFTTGPPATATCAWTLAVGRRPAGRP